MQREVILKYIDFLEQKIAKEGYQIPDKTFIHLDTVNKLDNIIDIQSMLFEHGSRIGITYTPFQLTADELYAVINDLEEPVLLFGKSLDILVYLEPYKRKKIRIHKFSHIVQEDVVSVRQIHLDDFYQHEGKFVVIVPVKHISIFGGNLNTKPIIEKKYTPVQRFFRLLKVERRDIIYLYIYAVINGLMSLSLPVGVQAIIGLVMGAQISTSLIVLVTLVILGVIFSGVLTIMQQWIVEAMQQRVFVRSTFEFAYRIPRIKLDALTNTYAPELMNRFFDTLTIQKGLPKLLIDFSTALLQIIFGLLLLSFYHPAFVFLSLVLSAFIFLIFRITSPRVLTASLKESKYKYETAWWLEELARTMRIFKLAGNTNLPIERSDYYVTNYLGARKEKFRALVNQYAFIILFKTIITGGLLILGSTLVMNEQINIGQFVAAEIIIILILNSVEKVILSMENIYDMITAVEKIGNVTDLELEREDGVDFNLIDTGSGIEIEVNHLTYKSCITNNLILDDVTLKVNPGEVICISGRSGSGKSTLLGLIGGLYENYQGVITFNGIPMNNINLRSLHDYVAENFSNEMIFKGSVYDNITVGRKNITWDNVQWAVEITGLKPFIQSLPKGFETVLIPDDRSIPSGELRKIVLARCLAERPKLLLLEDFLDVFDQAQKDQVLQLLTGKTTSMTVLAVSNDLNFASKCDKVLVLENGKVCYFDAYNELELLNKFPHIFKSRIC
ncbi:MAG: ATP-binding cassette domain-containing protein [Flavobacteriales bacterium]|nr:ATP-binding cassette domain-containing protein [Flavobacteriales bacterium]